MSALENSAKGKGPESEQHAAGSEVDTRRAAPASATGAEQPGSDVGSLGVGRAGELEDVDPLAIGLNDESSALGEVVTEVMDDNQAEGVKDSPSK